MPIRYILYFNEADILCALHVGTLQSIELATSDSAEIDQKLGCTPVERITYYDQSHTVGTDLKQAPTAHAFVLADNKTHLQSFLQGCMRMRGLDEQQTVSIIVPENTSGILDDLMTLMAKNEQDQLKEDNFHAALAKMDNIVRQDLLQRIAAVPDEDIDQKYNLGQAFKRYLIETKQKSLFEQYGDIYLEQNTRDLLDQHHTRLKQEWEHCLVSAGVPFSVDEVSDLNESLREIVKLSSPLCTEKFISCAKPVESLGTEVEHERETLKETEKETLKEAMHFDPNLKQKKRHTWKDADGTSLLTSFRASGSTPYMQSINTAVQMKSLFSDNLFVDDNYAQVYEGQGCMLCPYLKSAMCILFREHQGHVFACLIDTEDLAELKGLIKNDDEAHVWISDTEHTLLEGFFPDDIMQNREYQALIEQIRFFNGELSKLCEQDASFCWLNQESNEKLTCFHENIMPYRQTMSGEFCNLQAVIALEQGEIGSAMKKKDEDWISTFTQLKAKVLTQKPSQKVTLTHHEEIAQNRVAIIKYAKDVLADLKPEDRESSITTTKPKSLGSSSED